MLNASFLKTHTHSPSPRGSRTEVQRTVVNSQPVSAHTHTHTETRSDPTTCDQNHLVKCLNVFLVVCMIPFPNYYIYISLFVCNQFCCAYNHDKPCIFMPLEIELSFAVLLCSTNPNGVESLTQNIRRCIVLLIPVLLKL